MSSSVNTNEIKNLKKEHEKDLSFHNLTQSCSKYVYCVFVDTHVIASK